MNLLALKLLSAVAATKRSCSGCPCCNPGAACLDARPKKHTLSHFHICRDIHHGNGTQHIFEHDPSVLYISLHRYDHGQFYPGTGGASEVGYGKGEGFTLNVPWDAADMQNGDYLAAFSQVCMQCRADVRLPGVLFYIECVCLAPHLLC